MPMQTTFKSTCTSTQRTQKVYLLNLQSLKGAPRDPYLGHLQQTEAELRQDLADHLRVTTFQHLVHQLQPTLRVGDAVVLPKDCVRDLGVLLDSELSMRPHINEMSRSIQIWGASTDSGATWMIQPVKQQSRLMWFLDSTMQTLFSQESQTVHCGSCKWLKTVLHDWWVRLDSGNTSRLCWGSCTAWLPVRQRTSYRLLSRTYLALNSDTVPQYLRGMLHRDQRRQLRSNSSALQLIIPRTRKCIGGRAFSVYAIRLWNDLPVQIRNTPSHITF